MKKVLLSLSLAFVAGIASAQTVYFEQDFNDLEELPIDWMNIDADGDGYTWDVIQILDTEGGNVFTPLLRSASWSSVDGPLTPDNWVITPAIDLSAATGDDDIYLMYDINAVDADWDQENYTVYVANSSDPADLLASAISFNESSLDGYNEFNEASARELDITDLAGETVYVAFRHHGVSDQFTIELDNIKVVSGELGVSDVSSASRNLLIATIGNGEYKLQLPDSFEVENTELAIYNTVGSKVVSSKYSEFMNLNSLPTGVYIIQAKDGKNVVSKRFVKK